MRYPELETLYREVTNIKPGSTFPVEQEGPVDVLLDAIIERGMYKSRPGHSRALLRMRAVAFGFACKELGLPVEDKCMQGDSCFQPTGIRIARPKHVLVMIDGSPWPDEIDLAPKKPSEWIPR